MKLVIVESPTKARTLKRYLGDGYQIEASMGHVRDLPKSKLGVDVKKDFTPDYVVVADKEDVVSLLKKQAKKANEIYLSMDPDREGEAIAYHIKKLIGGNEKFKRVVFHQITKKAILEAFDHPRKIDLKLVDAQQARRVLDRLVGYTLSPVLWKKIRRGLSAGRVQSVAVRLIVEREREIEAFKPVEYWEIGADLAKKDNKQNTFFARLVKIGKEKVEVSDGKTAGKIVSDLKASKYLVNSITKREVKRKPYPPFTTSTLQQSASNALGFTAKRSMRAAQQLYERGHITYHRTDSFHLAPEAITKAREFIKSEFGDKYLPSSARLYKSKSKLAQEAHEAIRPTRPKRDEHSLKLKGRGVNDAVKLYRLIRQRFLASQMSDAVYDQTSIGVSAKASNGKGQEYLLRVSGSVRKFDGWRKLYKRKIDDQELPILLENEKLDLKSVISDQKFTEPPARYSDATLIKALEERGIGRPSTYAPTISTILNRRYVEYQQRRFIPTAVGLTTSDFLVKHFNKTVDYDFTAGLEEDLDKIALGKREWVPVIREFWRPFVKKTKEVEKKAKRVAVPVESTGKKCPECKKGEVVIRTGRFGKFLSCSTFPECRYTGKIIVKVKGVKCPDDGGAIVEKKTRKGRVFYGCANYPNCNWAQWKDPTKFEPQKSSDKPEKNSKKS